MNCEQIQQEIRDHFAAGEPAIPARLMTHQESCSECRDYFQSHASLFRAIDQGLSSIANSPVPPSLLPAVRARLAGQPAGHSFRFHGWPLAALATAALVVVFAFFWHRPTQRDKAVPDVARVTAPRTLDPERDTPESLKDYLASFDPHIRGLTGDPETVAAVAKAYRVYYKKVPLDGGDYTMDHTAIVYLMDKEGRFVSPFNLKRKPEASAEELRKYL